MQQIKKLTRAMIIDLSKKCKVKPEEWGYRRNCPDFIEIVNKSTGESKVISKSDYNLKF